MEKIDNILLEIFPDNQPVIKNRLLGGMMNETYIVNCNNKDYVLFIPQGNANDVVNRVEEKFVQNIASNLGITSKNIYFNVKTGIKCHEFIQGSSLNNIKEFDYDGIAKTLKIFHSSKILSNYNYEPFLKIETYYKQVINFERVGKDFDDLYHYLFQYKDFLSNSELVLSHNDFQKSNIIKSDDGKYYIIDFEFVANNDELYDIAAFGNNSVSEGRKLLDAYFDNKPSEEQIKKYYLWRIFISLQWCLMALIKDHNGEGKIHNIDFKMVSKFFLENAKEARSNL